ncbi:MAG TPA: hypothetical protein VMM38_02910 [Aridibacter sp.]|nr:hypothetical protein [Aridibacter sp.]
MKIVIVLVIFCSASSFVFGNDCSYWNTLVDPDAPDVPIATIERQSKDVLKGIECLLRLEGRNELGVRYGSKDYVSQIVPQASVEINALYQISELFFGSNDFAQAIALTANPPKRDGKFEELEFNHPELVKKAFISYRKWFKKVKKLGLDLARKQNLDPLKGSGVEWY